MHAAEIGCSCHEARNKPDAVYTLDITKALFVFSFCCLCWIKQRETYMAVLIFNLRGTWVALIYSSSYLLGIERCFPSTSTGTGQVGEEVRHARRDELISLQQDIGQNFAESLLGRQVSSLFSSCAAGANFHSRVVLHTIGSPVMRLMVLLPCSEI